MDQDWICTVRWVEATPSDGMWFWTLSLVAGEEKLELVKLEEGATMYKLGVYWNVWQACRKHNLRFRPWPWSKTWVSGTLPQKENNGQSNG